jgi:hypothetical protein
MPGKNQNRRRSFRALANEPVRDQFDYVYKTFELTSFDQLLREQERLNKKTLQLDALNEITGQSNKFMKFFKTVSFSHKMDALCQLSSASFFVANGQLQIMVGP